MHSTTITSTRTYYYRFQPNDQSPGRFALQCYATTTPTIRSCTNMPYAIMGRSQAFPFSSFTLGRAPALVLSKRSKGKDGRVMATDQEEDGATEEEDARKGIPFLLSSQEENIASDILQLIGWTPLIEMKKINASRRAAGVRLVGKMETYQPLCSVKDRTALGMIEDAEKRGSISPGDTLIEATSGNLGIGLAAVAIQKGYKFIAVIPNSYPPDKQKLIKYLGAEVRITEGPYRNMEKKVEELKKSIKNSYNLDQMVNEANVEAHYKWTGPEIWKDTAGKVDIFVTSVGSGGTLAGVGKYLKEKNQSIRIVAVEPAESPVLSGGKASKHRIQGIGVGFETEILKAHKPIITYEVKTIYSEDAITKARMLAREEGLLVGISAGANIAVCLELAAKEENKGKMIVTMLPSGADRYLSSDLFKY
ncbi:cysteine synthase [Oryza sativa Japonica Group]|nr:hypothetical protein DAI22_06g188700 [Oryza sativa Japonica Group]